MHPHTRCISKYRLIPIKLEIKIGVIKKIFSNICFNYLAHRLTSLIFSTSQMKPYDFSRIVYAHAFVRLLLYFAVITTGSLFEEIRAVCVCGRPCSDNFGLTLPSISPTARVGEGIHIYSLVSLRYLFRHRHIDTSSKRNDSSNNKDR